MFNDRDANLNAKKNEQIKTLLQNDEFEIISANFTKVISLSYSFQNNLGDPDLDPLI